MPLLCFIVPLHNAQQLPARTLESLRTAARAGGVGLTPVGNLLSIVFAADVAMSSWDRPHHHVFAPYCRYASRQAPAATAARAG